MNLSPAAEITRDALVAEFAAAVNAASNSTPGSAAEDDAFAAQATVNRLAVRLGLVDAVEAGIREAIGSTTFILNRDRATLGL